MSQKRILVVDDELNIIKSLSDLLTANGYEVITAMDGKAGVELATKTNPDLILLDIMMPKLSGIELLKKMKANEASAGIPIIVVSAKSDMDTLSDAMWNYADKYITKPYDPKGILEAVRTSLKTALS